MRIRYINSLLLGIKNLHVPVSVIIPTLVAEDELGLLFSSLFEGFDSGVIRELIVTDEGQMVPLS